MAQENCGARFRRYRLTSGLNARINQRQFSLPTATWPEEFDWPTLTFRDSLTQRLGDTEVRYRAAKGETDDHLYAWLPERGYESGPRPRRHVPCYSVAQDAVLPSVDGWIIVVADRSGNAGMVTLQLHSPVWYVWAESR